MSSLNQVTLMGNITRDIEVRFTPSGMAVATIGLAMNRKFRDKKTNELRDDPTFVDFQVWGKTCEMVQKYFQKGSPILVTGRLKNEKWIDKQTQQPRQRMIVVADQICFCGDTKKQPQGAARPATGPQAPAADGPDFGTPPEDLEIQEENIPF